MRETRKQNDEFWDKLNDNVDEYVKSDEGIERRKIKEAIVQRQLAA